MTKTKIALFSEGNNYYSTFKPIIDSFLIHNIDFRYYTLDSKDKIHLSNNNKYKSVYLGSGFFAYLKFLFINADYLLSTTPNINSPVYPLRRAIFSKKLVHVFHSVSDISIL